METAIDRAVLRSDAVIAVHSHPGGLFAFSGADDESDHTLMSALRQGTDQVAGSAVIVPSGAVRARVYENDRAATAVDLVMKRRVGSSDLVARRRNYGRPCRTAYGIHERDASLARPHGSIARIARWSHCRARSRPLRRF